jgi:hypothetical protein
MEVFAETNLERRLEKGPSSGSKKGAVCPTLISFVRED